MMNITMKVMKSMITMMSICTHTHKHTYIDIYNIHIHTYSTYILL